MTPALIIKYLPTALAVWRSIKAAKQARAEKRVEDRLREYREAAALHDLERGEFRKRK